jgi:hypothetical protein
MNPKVKNIRRLFKTLFNYKVKIKGFSFYIAIYSNETDFMLTRGVAVDYADGEDWKSRILTYRNDAEKTVMEHPEWYANPNHIKEKITLIDKLLPVWSYYLQ